MEENHTELNTEQTGQIVLRNADAADEDAPAKKCGSKVLSKKEVLRAYANAMKALQISIKTSTITSPTFMEAFFKMLRSGKELIISNPLRISIEKNVWKHCFLNPVEFILKHDNKCSEMAEVMENLISVCYSYYCILSVKLLSSCNNFNITSQIGLTAFPISWKISDEKQDNSYQLMLFYCFLRLGDMVECLCKITKKSEYREAINYYRRALIVCPDQELIFERLAALAPKNDHLDLIYYRLRCADMNETINIENSNLVEALQKVEEEFKKKLVNNKKVDMTFLNSIPIDMLYVTSTARILLYFLQHHGSAQKMVEAKEMCKENSNLLAMRFDELLQQQDDPKLEPQSPVMPEKLHKLFSIQMIIVKHFLKMNLMPELNASAGWFISNCNILLSNILRMILNQNSSSNFEELFHSLNRVQECRNPSFFMKMIDKVPSSLQDDLSELPLMMMDIAKLKKEGDDNLTKERKIIASTTSSIQAGMAEPEVLDESSSETQLVTDFALTSELTLAKMMESIFIGDDEKMGTDEEIQLNSTQNVQKMLKYLSKCPWLITLKDVCYWLQENDDFLSYFSVMMGLFWQLLAKFLNVIPNENEIANLLLTDDKLAKELNGIVSLPLCEWNQTVPLPEDLPHCSILRRNFVSKADYSLRKFSNISLTIIRIWILRSFGLRLIKRGIVKYDYNDKTCLYSCDNNSYTEELSRSSEQDIWQGGFCIPVTVVVDASVLRKRLFMLKKMVADKMATVIIPFNVFDELDTMKSEDGPSRTASRWIESQLHLRNPHVRLQLPNKDPEVRQFIVDNLGENAKFLGLLHAGCSAKLKRKDNNNQNTHDTSTVIVTSWTFDSDEVKTLIQSIQTLQLKSELVFNYYIYYYNHLNCCTFRHCYL
ncbi:Protein SMG7 [Trichinella pseudospiralis]|uniref:Protein SMG7 n=1 Tax=Trichinella pseudospiralis TaxID=6337 RepID=A0A0V1G4U8_TRIPS|nr:Protein SMG7 [Trichinella pseudospiralis]